MKSTRTRTWSSWERPVFDAIIPRSRYRNGIIQAGNFHHYSEKMGRGKFYGYAEKFRFSIRCYLITKSAVLEAKTETIPNTRAICHGAHIYHCQKFMKAKWIDRWSC
ncbi:hypothetical protein T4A_6858 [Trichinella pseudospiralis]|uniref:Uncharacterized protein n=1 Tax=Trichinella pseudospiralis TaxID=6337 RepID=A0A0V1ENT2_TRIPS|nr:hypothetical protein T4A_6858 [Trichinella pseudospiralis]